MRILCFTAVLLSSCHRTPPPVPQNVPLLPIALTTGSMLATALASQAVQNDDVVGCWSASVAAHGLALAATSVALPELPELDIDLSACVTLSAPPVAIALPPVVTTTFALALGPLQAAVAGVEDCRTRAVAAAVTSWLGSAAPEVFAELAAPDGKMHIDAVQIATCL